MTEWLKVPVLKTGVGIPYRGFESHSLRHVELTRTLGSWCTTEGIYIESNRHIAQISEVHLHLFLSYFSAILLR